MRTHRITGVVVSTALVTALIGGVLGATSASADASRHHGIAGHPAVPSAPADPKTIIAQAKALGGLGDVAKPVSKLVEDALTSPMSTETVLQDANEANAAIDDAQQTLPAAPADSTAPQTSTAPAAPAAPATPAAPSVGMPAQSSADNMPKGVPFAPRTARDATSDALASLQAAVAGLVKTVTDLVGTVVSTVSGLLTAATGVLTGLVGTVGAILGGLGLPVSLPALPAAPALPSTSALPATPAVPAL